MMTPKLFLLLNLALAFYNVGTIWAHETDIFRTWKLIDSSSFPNVQTVHWKKLPYWVFAPVALSFIGSVFMLWYHPPGITQVQIGIVIGLQLLSHLLTALFWGQWQAKLSRDSRGAQSPYLEKILKTHWVRTLLINSYAFMLLYLTFLSLG